MRRTKTVQKEYPLHVSNVNLIDPEQKKATRIYYAFSSAGEKHRVSKLSGAIIPKPERDNLKYSNRIKNRKTGIFDTPPEEVLTKTYKGEDFTKVYMEFQEFISKK